MKEAVSSRRRRKPSGLIQPRFARANCCSSRARFRSTRPPGQWSPRHRRADARVLDNVAALLEAGNRSFADVVRTTIFLATERLRDRDEITVSISRSRTPRARPCRSRVFRKTRASKSTRLRPTSPTRPTPSRPTRPNPSAGDQWIDTRCGATRQRHRSDRIRRKHGHRSRERDDVGRLHTVESATRAASPQRQHEPARRPAAETVAPSRNTIASTSTRARPAPSGCRAPGALRHRVADAPRCRRLRARPRWREGGRAARSGKRRTAS